MGLLFSWPFIVAAVVYAAVKTGFSHRLYCALMNTSLHEVTLDEYRQFMHAYSGQLTWESIVTPSTRTNEQLDQYTDLLGKTRAMAITCPDADGNAHTTYHVSHHWWRRRSDNLK